MKADKTFPAAQENLRQMLHFILEKATEAGFNEKQKHKIELASEEALVNIIHYAYPQAQGLIEISCSISLSEFTITIRDQGIPFNPLGHKKGSSSQDTIGGRGIPLILKLIDKVKYKRENNCNVLFLSVFSNNE